MIARIYIITFILLFLVGCGGSSGGTDENTVTKEQDTYTGSIDTASINPESTGFFLNLLFNEKKFIGRLSVVLQHQAVHSRSATQASTQQSTPLARTYSRTNVHCTDGGVMVLSGEVTDYGSGNVEIVFKDCVINGITYNGYAESKILSKNVEEITYYKTKISIKDDDYYYSGKIKYTVTLIPGCYEEKTTMNLVIVNSGNSIQEKYENFNYNYVQFDCFVKREDSLNGKIYHSDYGYIEVSTQAKLKFSDDKLLYPDLAGKIILYGNDSKSIFEVVEKKYLRPGCCTTYSVFNHLLSIDTTNDGAFEYVAHWPTELSEKNALNDIRDNDKDGLPNSWEIVVGLNPENNEDADLDLDNDNYTNLQEYLYNSIPNDKFSLPVITELKLVITNPKEPPRAGNPILIPIGVKNLDNSHTVADTYVLVTKDSRLSWANDECSIVSEHVKRCYIDYIWGKETRWVGLLVIADEPGNYLISAEAYSDSLPELDLSDNASSFSIDVGQRRASLSISSYNTEDFFGLEGLVRTATYQMRNLGPDTAKNSILTFPIPSGVSILSAEFSSNNGDTKTHGACKITSDVVCEMGQLKNYAEVVIISQWNSSGFIPYELTVSSEAVEFDLSDNKFIGMAYIGKPLTPYQTLIDEASPGDSIFIPEGSYYGNLDLKGKSLMINGEGSSKTHILLENTVYVASDSSIKDIHIAGPTSGISGETALYLFGANITLEGNVFDRYNSRIAIAPDSQVWLNKNYFIKKKDQTFCQAYIRISADFNLPKEKAADFVITNNIFELNKKCVGISAKAIFVNKTNRFQKIMNNVFYGTDPSWGIQLYNNVEGIQETTSILNIGNNVFSNLDRAINGSSVVVTETSPEIVTEPAIINAHHNIFYSTNLNFGFQLPGDDLNIYDNPMFKDVTNNDFRLSQGSPAIDAGDNLNSPAADFNGTIRPQDGDLDGISDTDIGAFEYIPGQ